MKALKSDLARSLVSVDWNTMTAKASDGTEYRMSAVSSTPTSGAVEKAAQCLHCGKGVPEIDNCEDARFCNIAMVAAPHPSEAKAGELTTDCFVCDGAGKREKHAGGGRYPCGQCNGTGKMPLMLAGAAPAHPGEGEKP